MAVKKVYVDLDGRFVNTLLNWRITNLTTVQRNQLATQLGAANIGLPVFDTTANSLFVWGGSTWLPVGAGIITNPAGNDGDVQFNNNGVFGGIDQFVWNATNSNLLIGSNVDNNTARIQVIDGTGQNQLALHYDASDFAQFTVDSGGGLTIASVGEGEPITIASSLVAQQGVYIEAGSFLAWGTPSIFTTNIGTFADGDLVLFDSTNSTFNYLQFGGITSDYPALHRNGVNLEIMLAHGSTYSNLALSKLLMQSSVLGTPVNGTLETDYTNLYFTLGGVRKQVSFSAFELELSTTGTTGASTYIGTQLNIPIYQGQITLTTTGTTGVATLVGNDLNIPNYTAPSGYTLPPATYSSLGGVIVGSNLWVNSSGLLNLQGSGVTSALGYTPYNATNPAGYITGITGVMVDNALGYTPLDPSGTSAQYFAGNGQLFTFPTIPTPGGSNMDIQYNNSGAFGGTNAFTWSGSLFYVSGNTQITSLGSTGTTMVVATSTGLLQTQTIPTGYTLTPATNSTLGGVIIGSNLTITNTGVLSLQSSGVTGALGFTPYNATNPSNYIPLTALSAVAPINYNNASGIFTISQATNSLYGVIEVGANIGVSNGVISLQSSGVTNALGYTPVSGPAGSNTQIQFNNSGVFGASSNLEWIGTSLNITGTTKITYNVVNILAGASGLTLINNTPATSIQQQWSPALIFGGNAWNTASSGSNYPVQYAIQEYVQSANTPYHGLNFMYSTNSGSSYNGVFAVGFEAGLAGITIGGAPTAGVDGGYMLVMAGLPFNIYNNSNPSANNSGHFLLGGGAASNTSNSTYGIGIGSGYSAGAGSGNFAQLLINGTINQTTGSTGVMRGLYINPTLTSFATYHAIEVAAGNSIFAASTTTGASIRLPSGTAPTIPVVGDMWVAGGHLFVCLTAGVATQIV